VINTSGRFLSGQGLKRNLIAIVPAGFHYFSGPFLLAPNVHSSPRRKPCKIHAFQDYSCNFRQVEKSGRAVRGVLVRHSDRASCPFRDP
jgi:hypothetical protein